MKAQDLKNSILQLAIQGKLVPQDASDEPAEVLYAKIQAEKQKLIKEGKIKKDKTLPPITDDEIPFEIPSTWKWVRLGDIGESRIGLTYHPEDISDDGMIVLRSSNIQNNKLSFNDVVRVKASVPNNLLVNTGDIIICARNGSKALVGKSAIIQDIKEPMTFGAFMAIYKSPINEYVKIYLDSPLFKKTLDAVNTVTINQITQKNLNNAIIPLPPLSEQKRIVAKIEELEPFVKQYDKAETELSALNGSFPEQLKKSILQYAIQGKLVAQDANDESAEALYDKIQAEKQRLIKEGKIKKDKPLPPITDDEIPFTIPSTWKWVRWGNLSQEIQYGYNASAQETGRIKMLRISDIQNGKVSWNTVPYCEINEKEIPNYVLKQNDILFARTGGTVGKSYLVKEVPVEAIYAGYLIRTRYSLKLSPEYMKYFMDSQLYWDQLRNGTIATAQPNCNGQTLSKMLIPLPPLAEQHRIVAKVNDLMQYCEELTHPEKRKEVEPITIEWLIDKGFDSCKQNGYTDVNAILDELNIAVMQDRNLKKGRIEYDNNKKKFQIWVNDLNDNWTKAHELVHYVNDNNEIKLYGAVGRKDETSLSKSKERNVDVLTAEILMPEDIFVSAVEQDNIGKYAFVDNATIRKLGKQFRVSDDAVKIRLQNLGYHTK